MVVSRKLKRRLKPLLDRIVGPLVQKVLNLALDVRRRRRRRW